MESVLKKMKAPPGVTLGGPLPPDAPLFKKGWFVGGVPLADLLSDDPEGEAQQSEEAKLRRLYPTTK